MSFPGVAPPDYSTLVGKFRQHTGDISYEPLDPPVAGQGDYKELSDAEIESWLEQSDDSLYWALAWYYQTVARAATLVARDIADHDLRVKTERRAELLQQYAQDFWDKAEAEDAKLGIADIFEITNIDQTKRYPEGMSVPVF